MTKKKEQVYDFDLEKFRDLVREDVGLLKSMKVYAFAHSANKESVWGDSLNLLKSKPGIGDRLGLVLVNWFGKTVKEGVFDSDEFKAEEEKVSNLLREKKFRRDLSYLMPGTIGDKTKEEENIEGTIKAVTACLHNKRIVGDTFTEMDGLMAAMMVTEVLRGHGIYPRPLYSKEEE